MSPETEQKSRNIEPSKLHAPVQITTSKWNDQHCHPELLTLIGQRAMPTMPSDRPYTVLMHLYCTVHAPLYILQTYTVQCHAVGLHAS